MKAVDSNTVDLIGLSWRSKSQNMLNEMISISFGNSLSIRAEYKPAGCMKDLGFRPTWRC